MDTLKEYNLKDKTLIKTNILLYFLDIQKTIQICLTSHHYII